MSSYIPVIGLEIHAELLTKSKVFCTCSAEFGGSQNSRCCPVCTGMPGTLPVINQTAVEYAVKAGMALGCDISKFSVFDRKNYFYPDLPKAYQISQLYYPLCLEGKVAIDTPDGQKYIRINHIHLEEDAGKLVHDDFNAVSLADYNRCGIPLVEIVTEPDISSAEEAKAFIEKVMLLLQYAGVSDCKMEEGSLRCDVNVSIMRPGDKELGTRAEIKNMNSLKSITRAINYEIKRQSRLLDAGKKVVQETRRFNENKGETSSMRSKENAHDYRYFPEPDILQVNFTDEMLDSIKNMLPELPYKRMERYMKDYGLSKTDAQILGYDDRGRLTATDVKLTLIPYYAWAHRGAGAMAVWLPQELSASRPTMPATLASESKVDASHKVKSISAINDRLVPKDENDRSVPYYHWWPKQGTTEWITYEFPAEAAVSSSTVYWFDDAPWGGCRVPKSWKIYYKDAQGQWQPVTGADKYGVVKGAGNTVNFDPVKTKSIKLEITLPDKHAAGVYEWEVQ